MDWSRPLSALFPAVHGATLEALWRRSTPMTGREVHRVARSGSYTGVLAALSRLVEQGLVTSRRVGQADEFSLNTEHLVYPAVDAALSAFSPRTSLDHRWRALVQATLPNAEHRVSLAYFGSFARGEATSTSDIDLLLVLRDVSDDDRDRLVDALEGAGRRWTGNAIQVFVTDDVGLADAVRHRDPIVGEWLDDVVPILGPDVRTQLLESR